MRRRQVLVATAFAAGARAWGADVMRIVVAYPPGGVSDQVARLLAERLGPMLGTTVLVASHDQDLVARSGMPVMRLDQGRLSVEPAERTA